MKTIQAHSIIHNSTYNVELSDWVLFKHLTNISVYVSKFSSGGISVRTKNLEGGDIFIVGSDLNQIRESTYFNNNVSSMAKLTLEKNFCFEN